MSKYFNRGLLYQWFNSAKSSIFIGLIAWGLYFDREILNNTLNHIKEDIANNQSDYFMSAWVDRYILLGVIFIIIYYMSAGRDKGSTMAFLSSGPFTKKQIKYNEFIGLIITLFLFVLATIYVSVAFYIRNREILTIVNGYEKIIFLECLRIFLIGILGILFMLIVNMSFSNAIASSIALIFIIPESLLLIFEKIAYILSYIDLGNKENIFDKLIYNEIMPRYNNILLLDYIYSVQLKYKQLFIEVMVLVLFIIIGIIIFDICQNRYKLENCNKIFSSKLNKRIVLMLSSMGISSALSFVFLTDYIDDIASNEGIFMPLSGVHMIKVVGLEVVSMAILISTSYVLLKRILDKVI